MPSPACCVNGCLGVKLNPPGFTGKIELSKRYRLVFFKVCFTDLAIHVNELILEEPPTGLMMVDYIYPDSAPEQPTPAEAGRYLADMLDVIIRFYTDAAAKATNPEAARTFTRIARKKAAIRVSLEEYLSGLK